MDIAGLEAEETELVFARFGEEQALDLGARLVALGREGLLPIVIDIRTPDRTLFHAALPGSAPLNDLWARRKSAATLKFHAASLLIGVRMREKGEDFGKHGLSEEDYANHGGSVPVRVSGVGVVAAATVSGLPQVEDHRLVVRAMTEMLGG